MCHCDGNECCVCHVAIVNLCVGDCGGWCFVVEIAIVNLWSDDGGNWIAIVTLWSDGDEIVNVIVDAFSILGNVIVDAFAIVGNVIVDAFAILGNLIVDGYPSSSIFPAHAVLMVQGCLVLVLHR